MYLVYGFPTKSRRNNQSGALKIYLFSIYRRQSKAGCYLIHEKIKEAREKYGIRAVFIDHLHYLLDLGQVKNPSLEIGTVIRGLKRLAIDHDVIIFLAAHTTKLKDDKVPTADDIRDSSFVGQESDCVMILWRVKNLENVSRLKVEFHRRIGIINKTIDLVFHDGELREVDAGNIA